MVTARPFVFRAASAGLNLTHQPRGTSDAASASLRTATSRRCAQRVFLWRPCNVACRPLRCRRDAIRKPARLDMRSTYVSDVQARLARQACTLAQPTEPQRAAVRWRGLLCCCWCEAGGSRVGQLDAPASAARHPGGWPPVEWYCTQRHLGGRRSSRGGGSSDATVASPRHLCYLAAASSCAQNAPEGY